MKGAFYGAQGDTNGPSTSPGYEKPSQHVLVLQGKYWMNPTWSFTYGIKQDWWSGQQQQCDFGPVSPVASDCFWDQPGFNYASDFKMHDATEYDVFLGAAYNWQLWTFTLGGVHMNKAYTRTPTEWGQSNTATFLNLGVYRTVPEIPMFKGVIVEVYSGLGRVMFGRKGPAPLGMPSNTAFGDVDPRVSRSSNDLVLGMNLKILRMQPMRELDSIPAAPRLVRRPAVATVAAACLALLLTAGPAAAATAPDGAVAVGLGTYYTKPRGGIFGLGADAMPPAAEYRSGDALGKAAPTSQWYSSVMFQRWSQPIHAHPMTYRATEEGFELGLPTKQVAVEDKGRKVEVRYPHVPAVVVAPLAFKPGMHGFRGSRTGSRRSAWLPRKATR